MSSLQNLHVISAGLSTESLDLIRDHADRLSSIRQKELAITLQRYLSLLAGPLKTDDGAALTKTLTFVRNHLCSNYTRLVAVKKLYEIKMLLSEFRKKGLLSSDFTFPTSPRNSEQHNAYRGQKLQKAYLNQLEQKPLSADKEFEKILSETCTPEIAKRLKEHVYNFKHPKHHRTPLSKFLKQIDKRHLSWHQQPRVIEGELLRFRNSELSEYGRQYSYSRFQNVKNAFIVLKDHQLISKDIDLPGNLRRDTNAEKIKADNPLLSSTFIYDERQAETFRNTIDFIQEFAVEIRRNLDILLQEARSTVWQGYQKFANKDALIANSQLNQFLKNKDIKIDWLDYNNRKVRLNPFTKTALLRNENLLAYFDYFFDQFTGQQPIPKVEGLCITNDVTAHLALTVEVASAMQVIIVEELGLNPYSLYKVKVFSDGRGNEFVQVTASGSVRIKALKPRARRARTATASGTLEDLHSIEEQKINAAVCLQMALEITERVRASTQKKDLWLCKTKFCLVRPRPESFQNAFNRMRGIAALKSPCLKYATLKKVRVTKGVWIYLTSNGDSLKTAAYLGNTVKTTLNSYIPPYLTELVFRSKIRSFQNILLYMSISYEQDQEIYHGKTYPDPELDLEQAFSDPYMGGRLYQALTSADKNASKDPTIYFCVSLRNIKLALKYAIQGNVEDIKSHCRVAIQKIAEGPVIMKQLLRQAEKQLRDAGEI